MWDFELSSQFMNKILENIKSTESQSLLKIHFFSRFMSEKMERKI
jgi:hypothetical protein